MDATLPHRHTSFVTPHPRSATLRRWLIALLTLTALGLLALGAWAWREACRRSEALAYIESMDGLIDFAPTSGSREWLRVPRCWQAVDGLYFGSGANLDLQRIEPLHEVQALQIEGGRIDNAGLQSIATFPRLKGLILVNMQITGSFRHLRRCRPLQELALNAITLADDALEGAGELTVTDLRLYRTPLTDAGGPSPHLPKPPSV